MKILLSLMVLLVVAGAAGAQELNKRNFTKQPGTVSGEIVINDVVGNGLGKFTCSNLVVSASKLGGGWQRKARALGDFSKRRCFFAVPSIPAAEQFVAVLHAQMPSCDQKTFETTTSFPMALKSGESMKYNFSVTKISCVLLK